MVQSMENNHIQLLEMIVWSISNLCRGKPKPGLEHLSIVIPHLCNILQSVTGEILTNACWVLVYLSDGSNAMVLQEMDSCGIFQNCASMLGQSSDPSLILAFLRILCNFVFGDTGYIHKFFNSDILELISRALTTSTRDVRFEVCFLLSNIAEVGGQECIELILDSPTLIYTIIEIIQSGHMDLKVEALWIVGNIAEQGSEEQLQKLVQLGMIPLLCHNVETYDVKTILMILDAIDNILIAGDRLGENYRLTLDEHGGVDMIESLQTYVNDDVYRRAVEIIDSYFGGDDSDDWDEGRSL